MRYSSRSQRRRSWGKRPVIMVAVVLGLALLAAAIVRHTYFEKLKPVDENNQVAQLVVIERGSTLDEIAAQLNEAGVIRSAWAFKLYVGSKGARNDLKAGTYSFSQSQSVSQVVAQLSHGRVATDLVTIIPGQSLSQIRTTLINYGFGPDDVDAALDPSIYKDHPALVDKPTLASLEGYIYPDSYQKDSSTRPQDIVTRALDEMEKKFTPELRRGLAAHGLSVYEAIILASVVENEVSKTEDRAQVAQVFLTRLDRDIALQSDATKPVFNSYTNRGLPPEPISNLSVSSLQAVANPAKSNWLYFVSGDDGTTHFARTLQEHETNVAKYCHKLCRQ